MRPAGDRRLPRDRRASQPPIAAGVGASEAVAAVPEDRPAEQPLDLALFTATQDLPDQDVRRRDGVRPLEESTDTGSVYTPEDSMSRAHGADALPVYHEPLDHGRPGALEENRRANMMQMVGLSTAFPMPLASGAQVQKQIKDRRNQLMQASRSLRPQSRVRSQSQDSTASTANNTIRTTTSGGHARQGSALFQFQSSSPHDGEGLSPAPAVAVDAHAHHPRPHPHHADPKRCFGQLQRLAAHVRRLWRARSKQVKTFVFALHFRSLERERCFLAYNCARDVEGVAAMILSLLGAVFYYLNSLSPPSVWGYLFIIPILGIIVLFRVGIAVRLRWQKYHVRQMEEALALVTHGAEPQTKADVLRQATEAAEDPREKARIEKERQEKRAKRRPHRRRHTKEPEDAGPSQSSSGLTLQLEEAKRALSAETVRSAEWHERLVHINIVLINVLVFLGYPNKRFCPQNNDPIEGRDCRDSFWVWPGVYAVMLLYVFLSTPRVMPFTGPLVASHTLLYLSGRFVDPTDDSVKVFVAQTLLGICICAVALTFLYKSEEMRREAFAAEERVDRFRTETEALQDRQRRHVAAAVTFAIGRHAAESGGGVSGFSVKGSYIALQMANFTRFCSQHSGPEVARELQLLFAALDRAAVMADVRHVATFGDLYLAVAGLGEGGTATENAESACLFAAAVVEARPTKLRCVVVSGDITGSLYTRPITYDFTGPAFTQTMADTFASEDPEARLCVHTKQLLECWTLHEVAERIKQQTQSLVDQSSLPTHEADSMETSGAGMSLRGPGHASNNSRMALAHPHQPPDMNSNSFSQQPHPSRGAPSASIGSHAALRSVSHFGHDGESMASYRTGAAARDHQALLMRMICGERDFVYSNLQQRLQQARQDHMARTWSMLLGFADAEIEDCFVRDVSIRVTSSVAVVAGSVFFSGLSIGALVLLFIEIRPYEYRLLTTYAAGMFTLSTFGSVFILFSVRRLKVGMGLFIYFPLMLTFLSGIGAAPAGILNNNLQVWSLVLYLISYMLLPPGVMSTVAFLCCNAVAVTVPMITMTSLLDTFARTSTIAFHCLALVLLTYMHKQQEFTARARFLDTILSYFLARALQAETLVMRQQLQIPPQAVPLLSLDACSTVTIPLLHKEDVDPLKMYAGGGRLKMLDLELAEMTQVAQGIDETAVAVLQLTDAREVAAFFGQKARKERTAGRAAFLLSLCYAVCDEAVALFGGGKVFKVSQFGGTVVLATVRDSLDAVGCLAKVTQNILVRLSAHRKDIVSTCTLTAGPLAAALLGEEFLVFGLFGDTLQTALRVLTTAPPGSVTCSDRFAFLYDCWCDEQLDVWISDSEGEWSEDEDGRAGSRSARNASKAGLEEESNVYERERRILEPYDASVPSRTAAKKDQPQPQPTSPPADDASSMPDDEPFYPPLILHDPAPWKLRGRGVIRIRYASVTLPPEMQQ